MLILYKTTIIKGAISGILDLATRPGLVSVCAKFQLSSWSRSGWKFVLGGVVVGWGTRDYYV